MPPAGAKQLTDMVTPALLRRLAGQRSFERGEEYFEDSAVRSLQGGADSANAVVQGTHRYRVRLWIEDGDLEYDCSCPVGQEGEFCKHCVAVGLALHSSGGGEAAPAEDDGPGIGDKELNAYLLGLEKSELVSLLLDRAVEDERLHRRLVLRAAQAASGTADTSVWRQALESALDVDLYVPYAEVPDHVDGVEEVIESLHEMLLAGQAGSVVGLAEYAIEAIEDGMAHIDDSNGSMGGLLDRVQQIHLEACRQAPPDPADLAERLFEAEMESTYSAFYRAVSTYAGILGETGLAAYRRLAEAEWAKVPALEPGDSDANRYGSRFRITSIMEALARLDGDLDTLVAVRSRDLSTPYSFLGIAQIYQEAGDSGRALDWAERGWQAFAGTRRDERLRVFLTDMYRKQGRSDEALALIWDAFAESPSLETYRQLHRHARAARQWPDWREKALALVRERMADRPERPSASLPWLTRPPRDHSLLVEIFLYEKKPEDAWREARTGGCAPDLWLALAKAREQNHPDDAVRIYRKHIDALLGNTGQRVYHEAVGFLEKVEAILARSGDRDAFQRLVTELRGIHRRKRNLIELLDRKKW